MAIEASFDDFLNRQIFFDECFEDRINHRTLWYEIIKEHNREDLARLGREIFQENDIYCGIRDREEFLACKKAGLFDVSVWVDASDRLPPEDPKSISVLKSDANIIINNNGTLEDLKSEVSQFFMNIRHFYGV